MDEDGTTYWTNASLSGLLANFSSWLFVSPHPPGTAQERHVPVEIRAHTHATRLDRKFTNYDYCCPLQLNSVNRIRFLKKTQKLYFYSSSTSAHTDSKVR